MAGTGSRLVLARGWNLRPPRRPLWVNNRHGVSLRLCRLYSRKRTNSKGLGMSASCHKRTLEDNWVAALYRRHGERKGSLIRCVWSVTGALHHACTCHPYIWSCRGSFVGNEPLEV